MNKKYSLTKNLFLVTAILGTFVCVPYLTNMIGIGEPVQLAFIIFTLITLFQIRGNKEIKKRGLLLIVASIVIVIAFIIAVLMTTNNLSLTMLNVFEFATSANSSIQLLVSMVGGIGFITCVAGVIFCYLDYFNLQKLSK